MRKEDRQVLGLIERFETDESLSPQDAEKLVVDIFVGCGLPALYRGGPGDQGADVEFTTDYAHGGDRFAVQVKTSKLPVGATAVQSIAGAALRGNFDRWLFVSRSGFSEQAKEFASAVRMIKLELLSPTELRRWITKFTWSQTAEANRLELIIRTAMKEVAKHLALCPADLPRVEWRDLERLLREAFEGIGFDTELTRSTKDGGFDLRLTFLEHGRKRAHLVEVKHWSLPSRPGSAIIQHFAHVVARESVEGGLLLSTSGFAETAAEGLMESEQRLLRLGNDTKIISLCKTYYKLDSEIWIADQHLPQILHESTFEVGAVSTKFNQERKE